MNDLEESKSLLLNKSNETNKPIEIGGPKGLEPTRYGDWEKNGRVSDF